MSNSKKTVAIVYGGMSNEHEISQLSACSVFRAIDKDSYQVLLIGGDKKGLWYLNDVDSMLEHEQSLPIKNDKSKPFLMATESFQSIDVVLPIIHGPLYEDGCFQGAIELSNTPYVGSNVQGSACAMDKVLTKQLVALAGVDVADYVFFYKDTQKSERDVKISTAIDTFGFPLFVKPAHTGSSVGVEKALTKKELLQAIENAFRFDEKILIEKAVVGREIEVAILEEDNNVEASDVFGEIRMLNQQDFYSYDAKYCSQGSAELIVPAAVSEETKSNLKQVAINVFKALDLNDLARIDFFIEDSGRIILNEVNTLPGFTSISMYPKLWQHSGIEYSELISRLIENALRRHVRRSQLLRDYV